MSTRGAIARPKGDGWEGAFHSPDANPSGLGRGLWHDLRAGLDPTTLVQQAMQAKHDDLLDDETADPLYIEWVYILYDRTMTILGAYAAPDYVTKQGAWGPYRIRRFAHPVVAQFDLGGPEPDWRALEETHRLWCEALPYYNEPAILDACLRLQHHHHPFLAFSPR